MATELDAFLRHQLYLEGYKNNEANSGEDTLEQISVIVLLMLAKTKYDNLGDMPKRVLNKFVNDVMKRLRETFNRFANARRKQMRKFMLAEASIQKYLFKKLGGYNYIMPNAGRLFAEIENAPVAGVGIELRNIFKIYINSVLNNITKLIKTAYADKVNSRELINRIIGTKDRNYRNGLVNKLRNQLSTTIQTTIQHISAYLLYKIGSMVAEKYQWVSVIDSATTDICRSRNGRIYVYGKGPRPPAHYNCRSTIIPVITTEYKMPTYYNWLKNQPVKIQNDAIGKRRATDLRKGNIKSDDMPGFDGTAPLTLEKFKSKRNLLTAD